MTVFSASCKGWACTALWEQSVDAEKALESVGVGSRMHLLLLLRDATPSSAPWDGQDDADSVGAHAKMCWSTDPQRAFGDAHRPSHGRQATRRRSRRGVTPAACAWCNRETSLIEYFWQMARTDNSSAA